MRRKPIAAALATLALALGMAVAAPAQQASALQQWSPWIKCPYANGTGLDYTWTSVQITWSGASGRPGIVTAIKYGNGNTEPVKHAQYINHKGSAQQARVAWDFTPRTSYTSPFTSAAYYSAGSRWTEISLTRQHTLLPVDDSCYFTVTY